MISGRTTSRENRNRFLFSGSIHRELGLTESEKKEEKAKEQDAKAKALGGCTAEKAEGDFGAFNFSGNISLKTISGGKHTRPPRSGLSQKEEYHAEQRSTHTFGVGGAPTFENLEGSDDESMAQEEGRQMDFDLNEMENNVGEDEDKEMSVAPSEAQEASGRADASSLGGWDDSDGSSDRFSKESELDGKNLFDD